MPKISVIVPCYNQAQYLHECLESVLNQSFQEWECIIVNDESPDNTIEIGNTWVNKDSRFKLITIQNGGVSNARNIGIKKSNSELILPLDADDKLAQLYLEKAYKELSINNYTIVYCKAEYFGEKEGEMPVSFKSLESLLLRNEIFVTALFRKKDFNNTNGFDVKMDKGLEDWEFWINLLSTNKGEVFQMDYVGFYYRIKESSRNQVIKSDVNLNHNMKNYIYLKHNDLYRKYYGYPIENIKRLKAYQDFNNLSSFYSFNDLVKIIKIKATKKIMNIKKQLVVKTNFYL